MNIKQVIINRNNYQANFYNLFDPHPKKHMQMEKTLL